MNLINTNKNNSIVKLFIPNIFEQEGGKKGGKKGKKGKKAKKKKKGEAGEKPEVPEKEERERPEREERERPEREERERPEREERERPEREERERPRRKNRTTSESSYDSDSSDIDTSSRGSPMGYSGGINSQIITSAIVPSNLQVDIDNQRENNTRQDTELIQLRDLIFNEKSEQIKLLKQKEEESRKEELDKILNEIEMLKSIVNKIHLNETDTSSDVITPNPTQAPVDQKAGTQNDKFKKYVIKY